MIVSDSRVTPQLQPWHEAGRVVAERIWRDDDGREKCPATWVSGKFAGKRCPSKSGRGGPYEGLGGPCMAHGGAKRQGRAIGAWLMAHRFAEELDVSPWEALLLVIRITAGRLKYIESVLATATSDDEIEGRGGIEGEPTGVDVDGTLTTGRNLSWWVEKSEVERTNLAKFSKAAIDAGVAQLLIEVELRRGDELAQSHIRVLEGMREAGVPEEMLEVARGVMRKELQLALEGSASEA